MIIHDRKKTASVILSRMNPDGGESSAPMKNEESIGDDAPLQAIAEDMILAFQNKSASDLVQALKAFQAMSETDEA